MIVGAISCLIKDLLVTGFPDSDAGKAATDRPQRAGKKEVRGPSDRDCNREETEQSPEN